MMYTPMLAFRMTAMYCWTIEVGNAAMIQVTPSNNDNITVFLSTEMITELGMTSEKIKSKKQDFSPKGR